MSAAEASSPGASSSHPAPSTLTIRVDDLRGPEVAALLHEHYMSMFDHSPAESVHALDLAALRAPEITFWSAWMGDALAGCVALKDLGSGHAELKSMRTAAAFMRRGVAAALMHHVLARARLRRITRISLETGSMAFFEPARKMYERFGFKECGPFGDYQLDPYSVFMTREIATVEEMEPESLSPPQSSPSMARSDSVGASRPTAGINFLRSLQMCFPFLSRFLFEVELYPVLAVSRGVRDAVAKEIVHLLAQDQKRLVTRRTEIIAKLAHLQQIRSAHSPEEQAALDRICAECFFGSGYRSRLPPGPAEIHDGARRALEAAVEAGGKLPMSDPLQRSDRYLVTFLDDLLLDRLIVDRNDGPNSAPRPERLRADPAVLLPMIQSIMIADTDLWNVPCDDEWEGSRMKLTDILMRAMMNQRKRWAGDPPPKRLHMPTARALGELLVWAITVRRVLGEHTVMHDTLQQWISDKHCKSVRAVLEPFGQQNEIAELRQIRFNVVRACAQPWSGVGESEASATASDELALNWDQEMYWVKSLSYAPADMLCLLLSLSPRFVRRLRMMLAPQSPSAHYPVPLQSFLEPCFRGPEGRAFLSRLIRHKTFREELLRIPSPSSMKQQAASDADPAALLLSFSSSSIAASPPSPLTIALLFALVRRKERSLLSDLLSISPVYFRSAWSSLRDGQGNSPLHVLSAEVRGRRNKIFATLWKIAIAAVEDRGSVTAASSSSSSSSSLSPSAVRVLSDCNAASVSLASMLDQPRNDELRDIAYDKQGRGDQSREASTA